MPDPAPTRLCAEVLLKADHDRACEEHGEAWVDWIDYTLRNFPDTASGLKRALAWCRKHDAFNEGRITREELRPEWRTLKELYWYDDTSDQCEVATGKWWRDER